MRGGVLKYAAQATSQIDAEIGKKDHFWMETNSCPSGVSKLAGGGPSIPYTRRALLRGLPVGA